MKLAIVVQRYGLTVNGGAELHARYIAERLARHAEVEVLTTCATDYVTWRNELPDGVDRVNNIPVRRFKVQARTRSARVRPALGARVRPDAFDRRRARLAGCRRTDQPCADHASEEARHRLGLLHLLQLPLLPRVSRDSCGRIARHPRPDRRARLDDWPERLRADLPRRPRSDVQLARREDDDSGRRLES